MAGTIKMFCIRINILSHIYNIELFLPCNMAAMQNLYFFYVNILEFFNQYLDLISSFTIENKHMLFF